MAFTTLYIIILAILASLAIAARSLAPWVPTHARDYDRVMRLAAMQPGQVWYEIGCGAGGVTLAIARASGCRAVGIERSWPLALIAWLRARVRGQANVRIVWRDAFKVPLCDADVVYVFGLPSSLPRLQEKLEAELRPGTRVISYVFDFPTWTPVAVDLPDDGAAPIYVYRQ